MTFRAARAIGGLAPNVEPPGCASALRLLKTTLIRASGSDQKKDSYCGGQFFRTTAHGGKKNAILVAVVLTPLYHMLTMQRRTRPRR